jgi:3-oxoacyl-[acyl-carrier protein] reductase
MDNDFSVAALYNRGVADFKAADFKGGGERFFTVKADVRVRGEVEAAMDAVGGRFGGLDCVINAAGISRDGLLVKYPEIDFDDVMMVNLRGCFYVIRAALPMLEKSGLAHIINVSSISGVMGKEGQCAYSASKGALLGLTVSLAMELGPLGVRVNALLPGYMDTPMGKANPRAMQAAKEAGALGALSSAGEAAEMILFILRTRRVTGQVFTLDGRVGRI